jgi:hypothetical protein
VAEYAAIIVISVAILVFESLLQLLLHQQSIPAPDDTNPSTDDEAARVVHQPSSTHNEGAIDSANAGNCAKHHQDEVEERIAITLRWLRKHAASLTFFATAIAALGALVYAGIAYNQLDESRRQTRMEQRAWLAIAPTAKTIFVQAGSTIELPVELTNIGKTPARRIYVLMYLRRFYGAGPLVYGDHPEKVVKISTQGSLWPGAKFGETLNVKLLDNGGLPLVATPQDAADWIDHKFYLLLYARMNYADVFGIEHWTNVCRYFPDDFPWPDERNAPIRECVDTGNNFDKNDQPQQ